MRAILLGLALRLTALGQPSLVFDSATQSVRADGIGSVASDAGHSKLDSVLEVFFEHSTTPMLGDYDASASSIRFTPRFPLLPGNYRAVLNLGSAGVRQLLFRVDEPKREPTRVVAVYPSASVLPANLLRFYVVFSQPMRRSGLDAFIRLLDEAGHPVEHPFLDTRDGLWDPEAQRLTLILDPGRIKRGLALHDALGPPLQAGHRYRLVISADAGDADGRPLAGPFEKEFAVVDSDRKAPDPRNWTVHSPAAGTRQPLIVVSEKALDEALFARRVRAEDDKGCPVPGETAVEAAGTRWRFTPAQDWRKGDYAIRVAADLEDLAGNRPGRLFDEQADPGGKRKDSNEVVLSFRVNP